ncbi:MAG: ankyrin repeat domain-containing protein [Gammaproteobacteria bacterium]
MKLKAIGVVALLSLVSLIGLVSYDVSRMDTETIVLCSSNEGGILIPSKVCKYYLFNYRDIKKDVSELSDGAGLSYILNGANDTKYEIAEYFISNGLDVNGINNYGDYNLTPIYGAILLNDVKMAKFLMRNGADLNIEPPSTKMSALEFCRLLQEKDSSVDRGEMLKVLSNK